MLSSSLWTSDIQSDIGCQKSIEPQGGPKLVVVHARKVVSRINFSGASKEELFEGFGSARTQRIKDASERDFDKKPLCARDRYKLEVIWKYPRPIRDEVILRERRVRIAASHHLGKIAMHNSDAAGKVRCLRCEERVAYRLAD